MLIALLTILILGGSSSVFLDYIADSKDAIKTVMIKDRVQKEALDILNTMKKRSNSHNKEIRKTIKEFGKHLEGRDDNAAEIAAIGDRHFENIVLYNSDILDLRFELKEHVSREEWAQIFPEE